MVSTPRTHNPKTYSIISILLTTVWLYTPHQINYILHCASRWLPQETSETQADYLDALTKSDLTLCPVGTNSESYRIYEAMAYGSVPVLENVMTPGHCGQDTGPLAAPFRLLKKYNAPVIFVKDWSELPAILQKEKERTATEIRERRRNLFKWYQSFKEKMRGLFVGVLEKRFFR